MHGTVLNAGPCLRVPSCTDSLRCPFTAPRRRCHMGNALSWSSRQSRDGQGRSQAAVVEGPTTSGVELVQVLQKSPNGRPMTVLVQALEMEQDSAGLQRLKFRREGWSRWKWDGHDIHYVKAGESGPPVLLIHGFGASAYHWRYQVPSLAQNHRVYAIDLLGFGWSPKALVEYDGYKVWSRQLGSFIKEVILPDCGQNPVLVGNSLGGYNALSTAAAYPELVRGVVLLNGAGKFEDEESGGPLESTDEVSVTPTGEAPDAWTLRNLMSGPMGLVTKGVVYVSFVFAKQPSRIRSVLMQVYSDPRNVDDDLVTSIVQPAESSINAPEVFRRIITGSGESINRLLQRTRAPLLLLWGDKDPWIRPSTADRVMALYPSAQRIRLAAGHCPHDETPEAVNEALESWLATLDK